MWCQGAYALFGVVKMVRNWLSTMWDRIREWVIPPSVFHEPGFVRERCPCGLWRFECFHDVGLKPVSDVLAGTPQ